MSSHTAAAPPDPDDGDEEVLAYAAWSRICEPTDPDIWPLIEALGAAGALQWLRECIAAGAAGGTAGPAEPSGRGSGVQAAISRWAPRLENLDPRRELETIARMGGQFLPACDARYPDRLDDLGPARPLGLWMSGAGSPEGLGTALNRSVAVVGSRAATSYGQHVAAEWACDLVSRGYTVVSGGAYGIDAAAHRGALAAGGVTVAILAGGLDKPYPPGNSALLQAVGAHGALVSELPPGSANYRVRFLQRNRLIAALTQATVVVEAGWRSGAQSTARHAAELLRPVAAVPGPVTSAASSGCHRLIREGAATCVTQVDELLELIAGQPVAEWDEQPRLFDDLPEADRKTAEALPCRRPADVDALARAAGLAVPEVMASLGRLELHGISERTGAGWRRTTQK